MINYKNAFSDATGSIAIRNTLTEAFQISGIGGHRPDVALAPSQVEPSVNAGLSAKTTLSL